MVMTQIVKYASDDSDSDSCDSSNYCVDSICKEPDKNEEQLHSYCASYTLIP